MRISTVIPTRNRAALLQETLRYLAAQAPVEGVTTEVIVVDDGSTDGSDAVVESFMGEIEGLTYVSSPRSGDEAPCVSRIRNLGVQRSTGDVVTFLDCGVLVPPCFTGRVARERTRDPDAVLLHYTVGLFAEPGTEGTSLLADLSPAALLSTCASLAESLAWLDQRAGYLELLADDPLLLPCPWTLGWSCALSAPWALLERAGLFDESLKGWGSEDIDLCYRLHRSGASFTSPRDGMVLHLPHPRDSDEAKIASNRINVAKLHRKHFQLDTELFRVYEVAYLNQVMARMNHLVLTDIAPRYAPALLRSVDERLLRQARRSLLIGFDSPGMIRQLATTHVFGHSPAVVARLRAAFPEREVAYLLGLDTPYPDRHFDVIVISDFVRALGVPLWRGVLQEACRISLEVALIYTGGDERSRAQTIDGWPWASAEEIRQEAQGLGLEMRLWGTLGDQSIFALRSERSADAALDPPEG